MMTMLREKTPKRRPGRAILVKYSSYRKTLREDFHNRCGYCGSFDKLYKRSFTLDHFIPQKPCNFTHNLAANDYYNLVYSCAYCNGSKTNKWPTNDITSPNNGKVGFIDPVDPIYDTLFHRKSDGTLILSQPKHLVSSYIYKELNLKNQIHSILWKLEKIDKIITQLNKATDTNLAKSIKQQLLELKSEYYDLTQELFEQ